MNKLRRHELKMLKFKRRMKIYGFKKELWLNPTSQSNLFAFRSHGSPCSCYMCSRPDLKYNRAKEKSNYRKLAINLLQEKMI
jgi:hypothetical protein